MSQELTLRPAVADDRAFLYALYADARDDLALLDEPVRGQIMEMQFRAQQAQYAASWPEAEHSIVLAAGKPVGQLLLASGEENVRIVDVSLLAECRGQGIGAELLGTVIVQAGTRPVSLSVMADNPAINLYLRLGFVATATGAVYVEMDRPPG